MEVPRRLYTTETGEICEEGDPRARFLLSAKGGVMTDAEAHRVGLLDYLAAHTPPAALGVGGTADVKAVEQAQTEDKAVAGPEEAKAPEPSPPPEPTDEPDQPPETRRPGGGRRGT